MGAAFGAIVRTLGMLGAVAVCDSALAGSPDTVGPEVTDLGFLQDTVNITAQPRTVRIRPRVTDDTGFLSGTFRFLDFTGEPILTKEFSARHRRSGTALNGLYEFRIEVPRFVPEDFFEAEIEVRDIAGNTRTFGGFGEFLPFNAEVEIEVLNSGDEDYDPPDLTEFSLSPAPVDVTEGPRTLTINLSVTDDVVGFKAGSVLVLDLDEEVFVTRDFSLSNLTSGNALEGSYVMELTMPEFCPPGFYLLEVILDDQLGRRESYGGLFGLGLPPSAGDEIEVINSGLEDTTPPASGLLTLSPTSVDVSSVGQVIDVTIPVSDDASGCAGGVLSLVDAGGKVEVACPFGPGALAAGDPLSGSFEVILPVPPGCPPGDYDLTLELRDARGRSRLYGGQGAAFPAGSDTIVQIVNNGPVDAEAPVLTGLAFSSDPVGVGSEPVDVTVTLSVADDHSGFASGEVVIVEDGGEVVVTRAFGGGRRTTGDALGGTYEIDLEIPALRPDGVFFVEVRLTDARGRSRYLDSFTEPFPPGAALGFDIENSGGEDVDASQILGLTLVPSILDSGSGTETVTATVSISDDLGGLRDFRIDVLEPSGETFLSRSIDGAALISGDALLGNYQFSFDLPRYLPPGIYRLRALLTDGAGRMTRYGEDSASAAFPSGSVHALAVINPRRADLSPPVLRGLMLSASSVDVSAGAQTLSATVSVSDDFYGLGRGSIALQASKGAGDAVIGLTEFGPPDLVSGGGVNGFYQCSMTVPPDLSPGVYLVDLTLEDTLGRRRHYNGQRGDAAFPAGSTRLITVVNPGSVDAQRPTLTSLSFSPDPADVSGGSQALTVSVGVSDDVAGFLEGVLLLYGPSEIPLLRREFDSGDLASGTTQAGTAQFNLVVEAGTAPGVLDVEVELVDGVGRSRRYGGDFSLYPAGVNDALEVLNTGTADTLPPSLSSLDFTPDPVDVGFVSQTVTMQLGATDNLSGVLEGSVVVRSAAGTLLAELDFGVSERVLGNALDGLYEMSFVLPQNFPPGYAVVEVKLRDLAGNAVTYSEGFGVPFPPGLAQGFEVESIPAYNAWASGFFGSLANPEAAPGLNPDFDLQDNWFEFLAGFSPDDGNDFFKLEVERTSPLTVDVILPRVIPGTRYTVRWSDRPMAPGEGSILDTLSPGMEASNSRIPDNVDGVGVRFYNVELEEE